MINAMSCALNNSSVQGLLSWELLRLSSSSFSWNVSLISLLGKLLFHSTELAIDWWLNDSVSQSNARLIRQIIADVIRIQSQRLIPSLFLFMFSLHFQTLRTSLLSRHQLIYDNLIDHQIMRSNFAIYVTKEIKS